MKKILGNTKFNLKTANLVKIALFLISSPIFSLTTAGVNQTWFYPGDQIVLTLNSDGNKVVFPKINNIEGSPVLHTTSSQKISIVNNKRSKQSSKSYIFRPKNSLNIPIYTLTVDGKKQNTQPIKITLKKPTQTKAGDDYILKIKINKQTIFLGDEVDLTVTFKEKKSLSPDRQISITMPEVKDLLFIKDSNAVKSADEHYNIHTFNYKLSVNNFGTFNIPSVIANISNRNNNIFNNFSIIRQAASQIKKIRSNTLTLTVNPLPDALKIFGDFKIQAKIDKTKVKQGEAINLALIISGDGNLEDIENFNLDINGATIYSDNGVFSHRQWQQKFAIVGAKNFIIPSLKFDYFDKNTQSKKRITTNPIQIQVETEKSTQNLIHQAIVKPPNISINNKPITNNLKYYYLLFGITIGIIMSILVVRFQNRKPNTHKNLVTQIKLARNDKALFNLLLPLNIVELQVILQQLEENIYKNSQHKIRKKDIIAIIKLTHKAN